MEPGLEGRSPWPAGGNALDRGDLAAVGLDREDRAGLHRQPVEVDRARAALRGVAADLRAGQVEVLAQDVDEHAARLDLEVVGLAVDDQPDRQTPRPHSRWRRRAGGLERHPGTAAAATSSRALPMPSTVASM